MSRPKPPGWELMHDVADKAPCSFCRARIGHQCRTAAGTVCEPHEVRVSAAEYWDKHFAYGDVSRLVDMQEDGPSVLARP